MAVVEVKIHLLKLLRVAKWMPGLHRKVGETLPATILVVAMPVRGMVMPENNTHTVLHVAVQVTVQIVLGYHVEDIVTADVIIATRSVDEKGVFMLRRGEAVPRPMGLDRLVSPVVRVSSNIVGFRYALSKEHLNLDIAIELTLYLLLCCVFT